MAYIVNGSIISDAEFEAIKECEIDKFNKQFLLWEILFITLLLFSFAIIFLITYGVYDVIHNGYTPTCICH